MNQTEIAAPLPASWRVAVVGTGLMGTSLALALVKWGVDVLLVDRDSGRAALAQQLGAGRLAGPEVAEAEMVIVAVPPDHVAQVTFEIQRTNLNGIFTDLASTKTKPQVDAHSLGVDMTRYVGGHPLAGRERSGPAAATAELFVGRPWVITPTDESRDEAVSAVASMASSVGAMPVLMTADEHDAAVAVTSHVPHVLSTLLAAQLLGRGKGVASLSGPGLQDLTRLAAGDPDLWLGILRANSEHIAVALEHVSQDLNETIRLLETATINPQASLDGLLRILSLGVEGRRLVPAKRGETSASFAVVTVRVRDVPGELARLLDAVAESEVNLEDLRVEHELGRPEGEASLVVRQESAARLLAELRSAGWHGSRSEEE